MNSIDRVPVALGGSRVPDSMGGSTSIPWQELPEQQGQHQPAAFGKACDAVVTLREQIGVLKKQLSGIAVPMKEYIYSTAVMDRKDIESSLAQMDSTAAAIGAAAKAAADAAAAESCLCKDLKAEAAKLVLAVRSEALQQVADCRALCLVTADKADSDTASRQQQQQQQSERQEFAKELYGDFNLQLGPISRKMFAAQTKLLGLVKSIKKQRGLAATQDEETN